MSSIPDMQKRVVVDTDPGVDDALALILALRSPELRVEAITTTSGNVPVGQATRNVFTILQRIDPRPFPVVAKGASCPLRKAFVTARSVHGSDGLGDLGRFKNPDGSPRYPETEMPSGLPDATEVLLDLIAQHPGQLTLITLGPLTNLAKALQEDQDRVSRLREVIIMGGAIRVPGNITPAAEFNLFIDPHAAQVAFRSGLPITLVPLDVTERVCLSRESMQGLSKMMAGPLGPFLSDATLKGLEYMEQRRGLGILYLHDPLAVGVAIDPSFVKTTPFQVDVETEGLLTQGMTLADLRPIRSDLKPPPNLKVAMEVDGDRFLCFFKERLCQRSS